MGEAADSLLNGVTPGLPRAQGSTTDGSECGDEGVLLQSSQSHVHGRDCDHGHGHSHGHSH